MCVAGCFDFMFVVCMLRSYLWMFGFVTLCLDLLICDLMFLCVGVLISLSYLCVMICDFMFAFLRRPTPLHRGRANHQMTCL